VKRHGRRNNEQRIHRRPRKPEVKQKKSFDKVYITGFDGSIKESKKMTQTTWIEIKPSGETNVISHDEDITMELLQEKVGGYFENCNFSRGTPFFLRVSEDTFDCFEVEELWCDEDGQAKQLQFNPLGTYCAYNKSPEHSPNLIVGVVVAKLRKLDYQANQSTVFETMTGLSMFELRKEYFQSHMLPIFGYEEGVYE
jgi:hypothetical protein